MFGDFYIHTKSAHAHTHTAYYKKMCVLEVQLNGIWIFLFGYLLISSRSLELVAVLWQFDYRNESIMKLFIRKGWPVTLMLSIFTCEK